MLGDVHRRLRQPPREVSVPHKPAHALAHMPMHRHKHRHRHRKSGTGRGTCRCLPTAAAVVNEQLAGRNYLEQPMVYMNDDSTLPPPVDTGEISSSEDEQQPQERRISKRQGRLPPPLAHS